MLPEQTHERLGQSLLKLGRLYGRELDKSLKKLGLTNAIFTTMLHIQRSENAIDQGELAAILRVTGPTLASTINELLALSYVESRFDAKDRRHRVLSLTPKGVSVIIQLLPCRNELDQKLLEGVFEGDITATLRVFGQLQTNLARHLTIS